MKNLEEEVEKRLEKEIMALYQLGVETNTDFLNLEHLMYRENPKRWKVADKENFLNKYPLSNVNVRAKLLQTGGYKNKKVEMENS